MSDTTTLTWAKSASEPSAYETSIGDLDVRVVRVDDIWFIKTRRAGAPFGHPGNNPTYLSTLRAAKAEVQRIADRVAAR